MKNLLLGCFLGSVLVLVVAGILFFGLPSERRLSDLHTMGFRMANGDSVLYFAKYLPDTLSPQPHAAIVVMDQDLALIGAARVPDEILAANELVIEADRERRHLQVRSGDSQVALRWSLDEAAFSLITDSARRVALDDAQLILRSVSMRRRAARPSK